MSNKPQKLTFESLVTNYEQRKEDDKMQFLLNHNPPENWVKTHPFIKGHKYLPIDKIEYLLRSIFKGRYKIEVKSSGVAFNGVKVEVRVHYKDLVSGEWLWHDGIGACELQTKKGTSPSDFANINSGAVSMAFPIAKTLAIKDACDHFGKLFGSDLNRKDVIPYKPSEEIRKENNQRKKEEIQRLFQKWSGHLRQEDVLFIEHAIETNESRSYDKILKILKQY